MALVRLAYSADLPPPAEVIRELKLQGQGDQVRSPATTASAVSTTGGWNTASERTAVHRLEAPPEPIVAQEPLDSKAQLSAACQPDSFEALLALLAERNENLLHAYLRQNVRLVSFEPGRLEIRPDDKAPADLAPQLTSKLREWTGERWVVTVNNAAEGAPTLVQREMSAKHALQEGIEAHPLVQAVKATFPGAEVCDVRQSDSDRAAPGSAGELDEGSRLE